MKRFLISLMAIFLVTAAGAGLAADNDDDKVEVLIGFEETPGEAAYNFIEDQGWNITNEISQINVLAVELPKLELPDEAEAEEEALERAKDALDEASGVPGVEYVELNEKMYAHEQEIPWGVERIEAPEAHEESKGDGVEVAIIDTGIDPNHETLNVKGGEAIVSARGPYDEDWADDNGHGTHVAGTAAALDNEIGVLGTAPDADLWAVKVLDNSGSGSFADVAEGIIWAYENNKEVINMSLGGGHSDAVEDAVEEAYEEGSLMVASAGNDGPDDDSVNYPAGYEEVIAVSATDEDDDITSWSSRGEEVELAAPGEDILSTVPGDDYEEKSGTSMSAPHVAGVATMVFDVMGLDASDDDPANVDEVREHLWDTAEYIGLDDTEQGHGLVNAAEAVGVEEPDYTVEVTALSDAEETETGEYTYTYEVENTGAEDDTYDLTAESDPDEFTADVQDEEITVDADTKENVEVDVSISEDAEAGDSATIILTAESQESDVSDSDSMVVTFIGEPEVETIGASNVTDTSATLEGELTDLGGADSAEVWFKWDKEDLDDAKETDEQTLEDTVTFEDIIDRLESETTYYFKALAENDAGINEGKVKEFTTDKEDEEEEIAEPEIKEFEVSTRISGPWSRADVEWDVYHEDGELDEVKSELLDGDDVVDTETTSVSGETASGEHELRTRGDADAVRLTVTDTTDDQETSETKDIEF